jgi:hypothetical protein
VVVSPLFWKTYSNVLRTLLMTLDRAPFGAMQTAFWIGRAALGERGNLDD